MYRKRICYFAVMCVSLFSTAKCATLADNMVSSVPSLQDLVGSCIARELISGSCEVTSVLGNYCVSYARGHIEKNLFSQWGKILQAEPVAGNPKLYSCIEMSSDGNYLVGIVNNIAACLWDLKDPSSEPTRIMYPGVYLKYASFSHDGRMLFLGSSQGSIYIVTLGTPTTQLVELSCFSQADSIEAITGSPTGRYVAARTALNNCYVWDLAGKSCFHVVTLSRIYNLSFSLDDRYIAYQAADRGVCVQLLSSGNSCQDKRRREFKCEINCSSFAWTANSKALLIGCGDGGLWHWDFKYKRCVMIYQDILDTAHIKHIIVDPQGYVISKNNANVYTVFKCDGRNISRLLSEQFIKKIEINLGAAHMCVQYTSGACFIYNLTDLSREPLPMHILGCRVITTRFSTDGTLLFLGLQDGRVRIVDLNGPVYDQTTEVKIIKNHITQLLVEGNFMLCGDDTQLFVVNLSDRPAFSTMRTQLNSFEE
jgi:WD40 repeat protein